MTPPRREANRGPAAAPHNRRAILAAARRLFAERGYHVPLSAVAREAGVGQGVLYRHFPTRLDLAFAVFEENFAALEERAAVGGPDAFAHLWAALVDAVVDASAFIEMVVDARRSLPDYDGDARLSRLIETALEPARSAGTVDGEVGAAEVQLALRMVHGLVVTSSEPARARDAVRRGLALLPDWARLPDPRPDAAPGDDAGPEPSGAS